MPDIRQNLTGLTTAVDLSLKSSEGQTENSGISKNFETPDASNSAANSRHQLSFLADDISAKPAGGGNEGDLGLTGAGSVEKRSAGRPKGSRNRSTEEWRRYFLAKFKSPLVALGELYSEPLDDLKEKLKCDRLEAFKLQLAAAQAVLPYVHQKQPLAIEDTTGNVPIININVSQADAHIIADHSGKLRKEITNVELVTDAEFNEILDDV